MVTGAKPFLFLSICDVPPVSILLPSASADGMKRSKIYFIFKGDKSRKGTGFAGEYHLPSAEAQCH